MTILRISNLALPPGSEIIVASGNWTNTQKTDALVASFIISASATLLRDAQAYVSISLPSFYWLMIFNSPVLPPNGTAPYVIPVLLTEGESGAFDFGPDGLTCSNGVVLALSSTEVTLTLAAAVGLFSARHRP